MDSTGLLVSIFIPVLICTFLATLRISFMGLDKMPKRKPIRLLTHDYWCLSLLLFIPWLVGEFARGETSAFPWTQFMKVYLSDGLWGGLIAFMMVLMVDIWLFWTPGFLYVICREQPLSMNIRKLVIVINILVGLLLITPHNPIYSAFDWIVNK